MYFNWEWRVKFVFCNRMMLLYKITMTLQKSSQEIFLTLLALVLFRNLTVRLGTNLLSKLLHFMAPLILMNCFIDGELVSQSQSLQRSPYSRHTSGLSSFNLLQANWAWTNKGAWRDPWISWSFSLIHLHCWVQPKGKGKLDSFSLRNKT